MNYDFYLASDISSEDEEQLRLDVERSVVDGLEDLYVAPLVDDAAMQAALYRLPRAWCSRHPSGYCQGMNFVGAVLLVVMHQRRWGGEPAAADEEEPPTRNARAEEDAFAWTFCALMEVMLPPDLRRAAHARPAARRARARAALPPRPASRRRAGGTGPDIGGRFFGGRFFGGGGGGGGGRRPRGGRGGGGGSERRRVARHPAPLRVGRGLCRASSIACPCPRSYSTGTVCCCARRRTARQTARRRHT